MPVEERFKLFQAEGVAYSAWLRENAIARRPDEVAEKEGDRHWRTKD